MPTSDIAVKEQWLKTLQAPPKELVELIVQRHLRTAPHLRIRMAIWKNAGQDPWMQGVDLVEICGKDYGTGMSNFKPEEFPPRDGWPRLKLILTDAQGLIEDVALSSVTNSFAEQLRKILASNDTALIFPAVKVTAEQDFRELVQGVV